ncbi:hypothetical protein J6R97_00085 [bacterium]|nr:hypothetical protein [bacterium]
MEVLSNREICILLKILSNKELINGSTSIFKVDSSFTKKELEHLKKEINLAESCAQDEIMQVKESITKFRGIKLNQEFNIRIYKINSILDYATKYVDSLVNDTLVGTQSNIKLPTLFKEFHALIRDKSDFNDLISNNLQYMPVILFAYINKLIDLKFESREDDDTEFSSIGMHTFSYKIESNGSSTEIKGTFYISDTSPLNDAMITLDIDGEAEQFEADFIKGLIAKRRAEKLSMQSDSYDEKALIDKLQKDFKLTETHIKILCACKYLMQQDIEETTGERIAEYLTKNNFPIKAGDIKQHTMFIKTKCDIAGRGVPSLVQALKLKGYIIPPLTPTSK